MFFFSGTDRRFKVCFHRHHIRGFLELNLFVCVCLLCVHVKLLMFGMFYPECTIRTDSLAFFQSDTCLTPVALSCVSLCRAWRWWSHRITRVTSHQRRQQCSRCVWKREICTFTGASLWFYSHPNPEYLGIVCLPPHKNSQPNCFLTNTKVMTRGNLISLRVYEKRSIQKQIMVTLVLHCDVCAL